MIVGDQPSCFPGELLVALSSKSDGTMLDRSLANRHDESVVANRRVFCQQAGGDYDASVYQIITYNDQQTYDVIAEVDSPNVQGVDADALYTETPGVGLFLCVADCVATVVYDPTMRALALVHLGRHSSSAKLMTKLIDFMIQKGSVASDLIVWMSPSIAKDDYVMEYFDSLDDPDWKDFAEQREDGVHLDMAAFNAALAMKSGVTSENIHTSATSTAQNPLYFSHFLGDTTGRFAVTAMIRNT